MKCRWFKDFFLISRLYTEIILGIIINGLVIWLYLLSYHTTIVIRFNVFLIKKLSNSKENWILPLCDPEESCILGTMLCSGALTIPVSQPPHRRLSGFAHSRVKLLTFNGIFQSPAVNFYCLNLEMNMHRWSELRAKYFQHAFLCFWINNVDFRI